MDVTNLTHEFVTHYGEFWLRGGSFWKCARIPIIPLLPSLPFSFSLPFPLFASPPSIPLVLSPHPSLPHFLFSPSLSLSPSPLSLPLFLSLSSLSLSPSLPPSIPPLSLSLSLSLPPSLSLLPLPLSPPLPSLSLPLPTPLSLFLSPPPSLSPSLSHFLSPHFFNISITWAPD